MFSKLFYWVTISIRNRFFTNPMANIFLLQNLRRHFYRSVGHSPIRLFSNAVQHENQVQTDRIPARLVFSIDRGDKSFLAARFLIYYPWNVVVLINNECTGIDTAPAARRKNASANCFTCFSSRDNRPCRMCLPVTPICVLTINNNKR